MTELVYKDDGFNSSADSYPSVLYLVALFCLCLVPLWVVIASKHPASQTLLHTGWMPIVIALVISRCCLCGLRGYLQCEVYKCSNTLRFFLSIVLVSDDDGVVNVTWFIQIIINPIYMTITIY